MLALISTRRQRRVSGFIRRLRKAICRQIEAVCMDLWKPYLASVRLHCPTATVVFNKFHVYTYLSQAVDAVRQTELWKAEEEGKALIRDSRWLLLRRTPKRPKRQALAELLALNVPLQRAHYLKEEFEGFYSAPNRDDARVFLEVWTTRCEESALAPFRKLVKWLPKHQEGIQAYFTYRFSNAIAEGINNTIKVIKRGSYGFHELRYFFLKILAVTGALPPSMPSPKVFRNEPKYIINMIGMASRTMPFPVCQSPCKARRTNAYLGEGKYILIYWRSGNSRAKPSALSGVE